MDIARKKKYCYCSSHDGARYSAICSGAAWNSASLLATRHNLHMSRNGTDSICMLVHLVHQGTWHIKAFRCQIKPRAVTHGTATVLTKEGSKVCFIGPLGNAPMCAPVPAAACCASASTLDQVFRQGCSDGAPAVGKKKTALYSTESYRVCKIGRCRHEDHSDACSILIQYRHSSREANLPAISWVSACLQLCKV